MPSTYPATLDAFATTRADSTANATTQAADHNNYADAINKIEAELGVNPSGAYATVVALIADVVMRQIVDAKGDILAATANDTIARLAVGATGQVLTVDPTTTTGVKWASAAAVTGAEFLNVKRDYGAIGNGTADDTVAIQAALNAVPANGGIVYFPPGDYLVTATLVLKNQTLILGCHVPRYDALVNTNSACKIRVGTGFTGIGLFAPTSSQNRGLGFHNIALVGNNIGTNLHCFRFADTTTGEMGFHLQNVSIGGFTGSGICGRVHVAQITNTHIFRCGNWCIETETGTGSHWNDAKFVNCYFYYGTQGCLHLGGANSTISGAVEFIGCRFERGGNTQGSPLSPLNTDAPGVKLTNAQSIQFIACETDANTGDGFLLTRTAADTLRVNNIWIIGCRLGRDGGGDQVTLPSRAGIRVQGYNASNIVDYVNVTGGGILTGKSDDAGGGILSPKYGVMLDYAYFYDQKGFTAEGATSPYLIGAGGNAQVYKASIIDPENHLLTIPAKSGAPAITISDTTGEHAQIYYDTADSKLKVRHGAAYKATAALT